MAEFSRTWWGQRFIAALEELTESGRLSRGRAYARTGRIIRYVIADGAVSATVRGSVNPYFGVTEAPEYAISIEIAQISPEQWIKVIQGIASRADLVTRLLQHEMPDDIEAIFEEFGLHLLPYDEDDFVTDCSCPDWQNPCKHIAGVYYLLASELDQDPFILFAMRGLTREDLENELRKTPLGKVLASSLQTEPVTASPAESFYTRPTLIPAASNVTHREYWSGARRLPPPDPVVPTRVSALLIKKQGDFPPFWHKDGSFLRAMEEIYERIRTRSAEMK